MTDLAVRRAEAFAAMELARARGDFEAAQRAKERLESLGIKARYMRTRWPKQARCVRPAPGKGDRL